MLAIERAHLRVRQAEADYLPSLLPTYLPNSEYVALNEGSVGEPDYFDLEMLQRDWWVARMMPGRHMLGIYLKATGEPVGMADFTEEGPSDGLPWLGALLITRDRQRQGLGREAFEALVAHFKGAFGWPRLRMGVRVETWEGWPSAGRWTVRKSARWSTGRAATRCWSARCSPGACPSPLR
jgi:RimJ/RimL family protein N-acetyltransferase